MNILVISDSHGRADLVAEVVARTHPDTILFAGDGVRDLEILRKGATIYPVYAVRGNCDYGYVGEGYAEEECITLGGQRILLTHGHTLGVKSGLGPAMARARQCQAHILVFGHTHEMTEMQVEAPPLHLICNPGSLGMYPHTFGVLTLQGGQVLFSSGRL